MPVKCIYIFLIDFEREGNRGEEGEREINLLFHLFMHSLLDPCMWPDGELNPQPWCIRMMLQPTELLGQGKCIFFKSWKEMEMYFLHIIRIALFLKFLLSCLLTYEHFPISVIILESSNVFGYITPYTVVSQNQK